MTAESDDPNGSAGVLHPAPADQVLDAVPGSSRSPLEELREELGEGLSDDLTDQNSPEAAQAEARALEAAMTGPRERLDEIVCRTRGRSSVR